MLKPPNLLLKFHRPALWLGQLLSFELAIVLAFLLRFDLTIPATFRHQLAFGMLAFPLLKFAFFAAAGRARGWWRYVSLADILHLVLVNFGATVLLTVVTVALGPRAFPRSIYAIDFLACVALTCTLRISRQAWWDLNRNRGADRRRANVLIYGAGDAGVMLHRELRQNANLPFRVLGFVDDDPHKRGAGILGVRVLGGGDDLAALAREHAVETVLVAIPSAAGPANARILKLCQEAGLHFKIVPGLGEIIEGANLTAQVRDVAVEDLLSRPPVELDRAAIQARLNARTVLVTGAAGSIGSELCRQLGHAGVAFIVGFDNSESGLFHLEREMRASFPHAEFRPAIGSVADPRRVDELLAIHAPTFVFHAAAYKHVPLMEAHLFEAVANNVFGTLTLAEACARARVPEFVMVSSDKAVRPTNVMGATKRAAELVVATRTGATKFVSVRFGNVLGSNGSVVPTFTRQIAAGGPVTVTHPDAQRYFMTIPEAAQLVLQAAILGRGREVFVLDMGEPVKIADLARNLIRLHGRRPDEEIRVEFTGLRPGEKLYEEISFMDEGTGATPHPRIRVFTAAPPPSAAIDAALNNLLRACGNRDIAAAVLALKDMVPDYNPSAHILRSMVDGKTFKVAAAGK